MITILCLIGLALTLLLAWRSLGWKATLGLFGLLVILAIVTVVALSIGDAPVRNWLIPAV